MKRSFLLHPGTVLSTLVLAGALAGSVYGATTTGAATVGSAQIKNGSIKLADISPKARKALRGLRGPAGAPGVAAAGATGPTGPAGPQGAPGTATAYATVNADGSVVAGRSKNLIVTIPPGGGVGIYCVQPAPGSGITPLQRPAVVTPTHGAGLAPGRSAQISIVDQIGCAVADGWPVVTHRFSTPSFVQDNMGFMIIVP